LDALLRDEVSKKTQKSIIKRMAYIEYQADEYYKELVKFYITKGQKANPDNFWVEDLDQDSIDKQGLSYQKLLREARRDTQNSINREKYLIPVDREQTNGELLELVKAKFDRFNSNNEYMDNEIYYFKTRRDYRINSLLFTKNKRHITQFSIYKNGVIEGYKEKSQTLGKLSSSLKLPLVESRIELIKNIGRNSREYEDYKNFYGVSINRLTFEFFELTPTKSIFFGISERDGTSQQLLDENMDCEVYSIIDIKNNSLQLPIVFNEKESYKPTIPKYDYNLLDNTDEHTIRRFMDFIYHENSDGYLTYDSNEVNSIATGKWDSSEVNSVATGKKDSSEVNSVATGKRVHFTKEDIDHKKGKKPGKYYRKVRFTKEAIDYKKGKKPGKYLKAISQAAEERVAKAKEIREKDRQLALQKALQGKRVKINDEVQVKLLVEDSIIGVAPDTGEEKIPKSILKKSTDQYTKRRLRRIMPAPEEPINSPTLPKRRVRRILPVPEDIINSLTQPKGLVRVLPAPEEPINSPVLPKGLVRVLPAPEEPINSPVLPIKPPIDTSAWLVPDDEDIYDYSGDEDDTKNNSGAAVKVSAAQNNSGAAVEVSAVQEVGYAPPLEQPLEYSPGYMAYSEAESLYNNDNNMD